MTEVRIMKHPNPKHPAGDFHTIQFDCGCIMQYHDYKQQKKVRKMYGDVSALVCEEHNV